MAQNDEANAVTAHWLLGRLSALQGILEHAIENDDLGRDARIDLLTRSQVVGEQMHLALESLARGHEHPLSNLLDESLAD